MIGALAEVGKAARLRTYLRVVTNIGLAIGTIGYAVVLAADTLTMILSGTIIFWIGAGILARLPHLPRHAPAMTPWPLSWLKRSAIRQRRVIHIAMYGVPAACPYRAAMTVSHGQWWRSSRAAAGQRYVLDRG